MKKTIINIAFLASTFLSNSQIPTYYNGVDFTLSGIALKNALASKITTTHTNQISYTQVWNVLKQSDLDPNNSNNVLLVYGWENGSDGTVVNDKSRDKNNNGGSNGQWNREHVYAKSLGTPDLGTSGPGSDAHNLKPADVQNNGARGNKKFANSTGNGGVVGANWYPGDEWKGDVARILMYMYVRYNTRCKPGNICVGNPVNIDLNMVDLLLMWNIQDPVNTYEMNRNNVIYNTQGNRNPFIDNPYLATKIWGGASAENTWVELGINDAPKFEISLYPNPSYTGTVYLSFNNYQLINTINIYNISGKIVESIGEINPTTNKFKLENLQQGVYFLRVTTKNGILTKKIIIK